MSSWVSGRIVGSANVTAEPHHGWLPDLEMQVGRLMFHDHAKELVDLRLPSLAGVRGHLELILIGNVGRRHHVPPIADCRLQIADRPKPFYKFAICNLKSAIERAPRGASQIALRRGDAVLVVMKNARGKGGIGAGLEHARPAMFGTSGSAAGDDRDIHGPADGGDHRQIVAVLGAVGVHRSQHDFAGSQLLNALGPGNRLQSGGNATAVDVDLPDLAAVLRDSARVDVDDRGTAAEFATDLGDDVGVLDGGGVDAC